MKTKLFSLLLLGTLMTGCYENIPDSLVPDDKNSTGAGSGKEIIDGGLGGIREGEETYLDVFSWTEASTHAAVLLLNNAPYFPGTAYNYGPIEFNFFGSGIEKLDVSQSVASENIYVGFGGLDEYYTFIDYTVGGRYEETYKANNTGIFALCNYVDQFNNPIPLYDQSDFSIEDGVGRRDSLSILNTMGFKLVHHEASVGTAIPKDEFYIENGVLERSHEYTDPLTGAKANSGEMYSMVKLERNDGVPTTYFRFPMEPCKKVKFGAFQNLDLSTMVSMEVFVALEKKRVQKYKSSTSNSNQVLFISAEGAYPNLFDSISSADKADFDLIVEEENNATSPSKKLKIFETYRKRFDISDFSDLIKDAKTLERHKFTDFSFVIMNELDDQNQSLKNVRLVTLPNLSELYAAAAEADAGN